MGPATLAQVLRPLADLFQAKDYPNLLVGLNAPDDAAVYRLNAEQAIIETADFFPPVVDDPYAFGAIAAANAARPTEIMKAAPAIVTPAGMNQNPMPAIATTSAIAHQLRRRVGRGVGSVILALAPIIVPTGCLAVNSR